MAFRLNVVNGVTIDFRSGTGPNFVAISEGVLGFDYRSSVHHICTTDVKRKTTLELFIVGRQTEIFKEKNNYSITTTHHMHSINKNSIQHINFE